MNEKEGLKPRYVGFYLHPGEYAALEKAWKKTTIRKRSEYVRRLIFNKPITDYVRNRSLDEFMEEMIVLRKELNTIGANFNRTVQYLQTLTQVPQIQLWSAKFEQDKNDFFALVEKIKNRINSISDQWLQ